MAYQSLYRRYRSQRFEEVLGQEHVTRALRNAVREGRVGQGYLFSGPRGTGKTSTARILAKVLNCEHPVDGEPDTTCDNCKAVEEGRQVDWLQELDAASNNGVDAMRDLLSRVSMGTSGNRKVYVLDEVHMLSTAASNALLKTLEEPPEHVVFVLATTEPEKVLPTIRSRTQHFEFNLLPADVLADHVRHVIADAGLALDEEAVDHVVAVGRGSARDTLSALDQVAAAGGVASSDTSVDDLVDALGRRDAGGALLAVDASVRAGRDPRVLAEHLIESLRHAFLVAMGAPASGLTDRAVARAREVSQALGPASLTRALEAVGTAVVEMRHAPDPRIPLEVALVQVARPEAAGDLDALVRRIEQLERAVASGVAPAPAPSSAPVAEAAASAPRPGGSGTHAAVTAAPTGPATPPRGAEAARARLAQHEASAPEAPSPAAAPPASRPTLGGVKRAREGGAAPRAPAPGSDSSTNRPPAPTAPTAPPTAPAPEPAPPATAPAAEAAPAAELPAAAPEALASTGVPSLDELTGAWDDVLGALKGRAKALYKMGRLVEGDERTARFAVPNEPSLKNCMEKLDEVAEALLARFGRPVPLELVVDGDAATAPRPAAAPAAPPSDDLDDEVDLDELTDAPDAETGGLAQLKDAFPGAELLEDR
ncbi:MAG TPA: DNA polymerase III subunit gamma/tau [Acidimicrobiales bacterium]|nr:DNA polymerase III subunit gamma/tau [Acidimicrobiales bacterium]